MLIIIILIQSISIFIPLVNDIEFSEWKQTSIASFLSIMYIVFILGLIISIFYVVIKYNFDKNKQNDNLIKIDNLNNDEKLIRNFIGKNNEKILKKGFSFPALFFNWAYILYRKMYFFAIIGMTVITFLKFLPIEFFYLLVFVFLLFLGLFFNKIYLFFVEGKVNKIKVTNSNTNETELINICKKNGGTNIWLALLIYIAFIIINGLL